MNQLKNHTAHLLNHQPLPETAMTEAMEIIMTGEADPVSTAAFLTALRMKGETVAELTAAARVLRARALPLPVSFSDALDTCGTGGDGGTTFNVSTAAALVAAAGGVKVMKHGNRAVSSRCGSADVLEALGIAIHHQPEAARQALETVGMTFLFAPDYHQSMKQVAGVRKTLGFRTIFNLLGPLANPGKPAYQVLGVYDRRLVTPMAQVLQQLGIQRGLVVHGSDGMDELTLTGTSYLCEVTPETLTAGSLEPEAVGLKRCDAEVLIGGDAAFNARVIEGAFSNQRPEAADLIALNAGAALYVAGKAATLATGVLQAKKLIQNGSAAAKLAALRSYEAAPGGFREAASC
ncbi:anthranilate phosphoribosyltransferase [Anoxynatronum buryatiense]|uniref:Anthranilate phosphoribosyltransferase n=1 Tax=Anoxynatronum buryatiense TaxID=489973 RepID=A0AA46AJM8_9CLOT|nr:anthranilate phosphoribosyltransferase [Anoxynatronum buryatiense]SMP61681.1 anthranilate phosphoribosyltransferase [Anoxynatronum buryatiense]